VSCGILEDKRPIKSLNFADGGFFVVSEDGVDLIEAYAEPGLHPQHGVPWFRVYRRGEVIYRCPAHAIEGVAYFDLNEEAEPTP
jgi:hypothetical protein